METWPVARIDPPDYVFSQLNVPDSYMAARQAVEVVPYLWVVPGTNLVTDAAYADAPGRPALQMVAHHDLPLEVQAGGTLELSTLWANRQPIVVEHTATLSLIGAQGSQIPLTDQPIVSGWAGTPTSAWQSNQFHDVAFEAAIPENLSAGEYWLQVVVHADGEDACAPNCDVLVGELNIAPAD
jgi:hypothetical protein